MKTFLNQSMERLIFYQNSVKTQLNLIFLILFFRYIDAIQNDVFTAHKYYNVSIMAQTNYFDFTEHIKVGSILIFLSILNRTSTFFTIIYFLAHRIQQPIPELCIEFSRNIRPISKSLLCSFVIVFSFQTI